MEQFNFRIIKCSNGIEVIDNTLSTPYSALTPMQMIDYINVENSLYSMNRAVKKAKHKSNSVFSAIKTNLRRVFA